MDPLFLLPDELEFELNLRHLPIGNDPMSINLLTELVRAEEASQKERPTDEQRITRTTVSEELQICNDKLKHISKAINGVNRMDENTVLSAYSRLAHVDSRVGRLSAIFPENMRIRGVIEKIHRLRRETDDVRDLIALDKSILNISNRSTNSMIGAVGGVTSNSKQLSTLESSNQEAAEQGLAARILGSLSDLIKGFQPGQELSQPNRPNLSNQLPRETGNALPQINLSHVSAQSAPPAYNAYPLEQPTNREPTQGQHQQRQEPQWSQHRQNNSRIADDCCEHHRYASSRRQDEHNQLYQQNQRYQRYPDARWEEPQQPIYYRHEANEPYGGHRIRQWSLRFSGSPSGIDIEDFIFRLEKQAELDGVSHAALVIGIGDLLIDRANQWYWTFQRRTVQPTWNELKEALIDRYSPRRDTDYDIKSKIENRHQRPNECFSDYCQDIEALSVRLVRRMRESELIEILRRNMRVELRRALCYHQSRTINQLLRQCSDFEKLYPDGPFQFNNNAPRRPIPRVAEIDAEYHHHDFDDDYDRNEVQSEQAVEAINTENNGTYMVCWNCKELGHIFTQCNKPQVSIFCFSCGMSGVMRPQCPKCAGNARMDAKAISGGARPKIPNPSTPNRPVNILTKPNPFNTPAIPKN